MIEIGLNQIVKNYGYKKVLDGVSLEIMTGERAALVGRNGTGKSTILRLIYGEESPDSGEVSLRRGAAVGMLEQIPKLRESGKTVEQVLLEPFADVLDLEKRLGQMEAEMADPQADLDAVMEQYTQAQENYIALGGYEIEERRSKVIQGFRLTALLDQEYNVLSGGQKTIVNLALAVLRQPDILLLDEPTNHLDMETLEWFESFLQKYRGTVVLVSHDRWFLDRVATRTVILEGGRCESFVGNYSHAMELREQELLAEFKQYKNQQKKIEAMCGAIKRFRQWGALNTNNPSFFRKAKELENRLEKMELIDRPQLEKPTLSIQFSGGRTGDEVLKLTDFSLSFGERMLFDHACMLVREKEKICLLGDNGTGKTSLIRAVLGQSSFEGEIKLNLETRLGYIPQEIRFASQNDTVLDAFRREVICTEGQARSLLAKYWFFGENVFKQAKSLSGGEKVLLKLAILVQKEVNFLILDEPTNHIDIETREILEEALQKFGGTLLCVSHDRYFIDKIATRVVRIKERKIENFDR